jgi:heme a synthase
VLLWMCWHRAYRDAKLTRFGVLLSLCVFVQIGLGIGTWTVKFGWPWFLGGWPFAASFVVPEKGFLQMNVITAHVATGSLILGLLTLITCRSFRAWHIVNAGTSLLKSDHGAMQPARKSNVRSSSVAGGVN